MKYYIWKITKKGDVAPDSLKDACYIQINKKKTISAIQYIENDEILLTEFDKGRNFDTSILNEFSSDNLSEIEEKDFKFIKSQMKGYYYAKTDKELKLEEAITITSTKINPFHGDYAIIIHQNDEKNQIALAEFKREDTWIVKRVPDNADNVDSNIINDIGKLLVSNKGQKIYDLIEATNKDEFVNFIVQARLIKYFIVNVNERNEFGTPLTTITPGYLKNLLKEKNVPIDNDYAIITLPKFGNEPHLKAYGQFISSDMINVDKNNALRNPIKIDQNLATQTSSRIRGITFDTYKEYKDIIDNRPKHLRNYYYAQITDLEKKEDEIQLENNKFGELEKPSEGDLLLVLKWNGDSYGYCTTKFVVQCIEINNDSTKWKKVFDVEECDLQNLLKDLLNKKPKTLDNDKPYFLEESQYYQLLQKCDPILLALEKCHNIVLNGAPGTGKTYKSKQIARMLEAETKFVQFHPSYDYTDFVEGLRPVSTCGKEIGFERRDGLFKEFCAEAAINMAASMGKKIVWETGELTDIEKEPLKKYIFIIDEINRGDMSKIFGELFYSIECDYRVSPQNLEEAIKGKDTIQTQYQNLIKDSEKHFFQNGFFIPDNVYIIGTMNDIDRSVESMDFAMRRRFRFFEITPEDAKGMLYDKLEDADVANEAIKKMTDINEIINDKIGPEYRIGPAYFKDLKGKECSDFESLWNQSLLPLIKEYRRGEDKDETENLCNEIKEVLLGTKQHETE